MYELWRRVERGTIAIGSLRRASVAVTRPPARSEARSMHVGAFSPDLYLGEGLIRGPPAFRPLVASGDRVAVEAIAMSTGEPAQEAVALEAAADSAVRPIKRLQPARDIDH